jgi:hypothetical protein
VQAVDETLRNSNLTPSLPAPGLGSPADPWSWGTVQTAMAVALYGTLTVVERPRDVCEPPHPAMTIAMPDKMRTNDSLVNKTP